MALLVAVVGWVVLRDEPYDAPPPPEPSVGVDADGAVTALRRLTEAIADDEPEAAARLAPEGDRAAARLLRALVTNATAARVRDLRLRYVDDEGGADGQGRWQATVSVAWRYDGFDRGTAHGDVSFTFQDIPGGAAIVGTDGPGRTPVWLQGPVEVSRSRSTLVVAARDLPRYTRFARAAVPVVRRVLPGWRSGLVVEVPADLRGLGRALAADDPDEYANVAAVTATVDGRRRLASPVHVFVNPDLFGSLQGQGAQVVMSHEAVHVATRAATTAAPLWLVEGFADYVALRDVDLPLSTTAGQVIRQVRRDGAPRRLPGPEEFDTTTTHLGATYEAAWLACRQLARRSGERALLRFYDQVDDGAPEGAAFRQAFGTSEAAFTRAWRRALQDLAR